MFGFKKKKKPVIVRSAGCGVIKPLSAVSDPVFSERLIGGGYALESKDGKFYAPISGTVSALFPTFHAIGIKDEDGMEVLVHVGLDTVELKGEGFVPHIKQGDTVKVGDLILEVDLGLLSEKGYNAITPVIVTTGEDFDIQHLGDTVNQNEEILFIKPVKS